MAEKIKELIAKRGQIKARVTRFKNVVESVEIPDGIHQLRLRLEKFKDCWQAFEDVQSEIELLNAESNGEWEEFEDAYFDAVSKAERIIQSPTTSNSKENGHDVAPVKLPQINLPIFHGAYDEWVTFYDTFNSLIHENVSLSGIQKFHYLRSTLRGEALQVIASLATSEQNYGIAWGLLRQRFENKRYIINMHVKAIFEFTQLVKESSTEVRNLVDHFNKHLRALQAMGQPTDSWDALLIHLITSKIGLKLHQDWEASLPRDEMPSVARLLSFLQEKSDVMETVGAHRAVRTAITSRHQEKGPFSKTSRSMVGNVAIASKCKLCKGSHQLYQCSIFLKKSVTERISDVKKLGVCFNCLRGGHFKSNCSSGNCRHCGEGHNSLLHHSTQTSATNLSANSTPFSPSSTQIQSTTASLPCQGEVSTTVLLSTAVVWVHDSRGSPHLCRALLDSGSQANFMTKRMAQLLRLNRKAGAIGITGIGGSSARSAQIVQTTIKSRTTAYKADINCLVLPKITSEIPAIPVDISNWNPPSNLQLADPGFNITQAVDLLIGAELFLEILCIGQIRASPIAPILQKTTLGWILSGRIRTNEASSSSSCHFSVETNLEDQVKNFWKLEECKPASKFSAEEVKCEEHFKKNTTRGADGRFIVRLPIKGDISHLGDSEQIANRRFMMIEKRLLRDEERKLAYSSFMKEYRDLGHMELVVEEKDHPPRGVAFYIPHHSITKDTSSTTKLRVVFDAPSKSSTGVSLNDILMVGPTIQDDLLSIIIRFRIHEYAMTADIEKMYRQIKVHPSDTNLQRILWRDEEGVPIETYRLNTVTYGTASASFLATRCLQQLALEESHRDPRAAAVVMKDFYVDDLLTGSNSIEEAEKVQEGIITLLERGGFRLRKWCSNHPALLKKIPLNHREASYQIRPEGDNTIRSLGILWNPNADVFHFDTKNFDYKARVSKRSVLSDLARIFDPLGLIGPIILKAKIFLQRLWELRLEWDESLPAELHSKWLDFRESFRCLNDLRLPRRVIAKNCRVYEIHGFCDASESAYGACVYVRSIKSDGKFMMRLLCSKSRVAPLKKTTLPRLELCAAVLLANLIQKVSSSLSFSGSPTLWSDSTVVLSWLKAPSSNWKNFVANRVAEIHELTSKCKWRHIRGVDNPADHISRGLTPQQLHEMASWWQGPPWMNGHENEWPPESFIEMLELPEKRPMATALIAVEVNQLIQRYSSLSKLQRVTAYCLRFRHNASKSRTERKTGELTAREIEAALTQLIKAAQSEVFFNELHDLQRKNQVSSKSSLKNLHAFLDENNVIRVGGRISSSNISYSQKHPIVLPPKHHLTKLIVMQEHIRQLHAGPQLLLSSIRQRFWPLSGRNLCRQIVHQCTRCFRSDPKAVPQLMGNLPRQTLEPTRPFLRCGVDYCGPIYVKTSRRRGSQPIKAYISVFVFFSTKAVHLELVGDLTTEAFLGALKRFTSRRGKCSDIYSDNGTHFVGANRELKDLKKVFSSKSHQERLHHYSSSQGINWHFIPPRSPHFGGLWEAAVRSLKYHLRRIVGNASLTYEETYTYLTMIEACLNSRPITQMSSDPNDLNPLTPGHFLIGDALTAIPDPNMIDIPVNRLSRWQHVTRMQQHFWSRWHKEYLSSLQVRPKWTREAPSMQQGDLVLIKEDNLPPLRWSLGRIVQLHPGEDGVSRVATVRTTAGLIRRAVNKLCPLPKEES
ncbi:uncharacterized protein LOC124153308 [Ischnura elegans]|uniref:uncharacterized protein LOC124153308 n=1 Tax=Ischnura elegans TaxID=197161 RepID=UPI001ED8A519|nr:uncharacterized protein LOC124153308 [Ischnura elegans]